MNDLMEVYFNVYCCQCKHENVREIDEPCNGCLAVPAREDSHKPEKFEKKETR